ncbi:MAG: HigA family addiction module antitoxin [Pseudomonadota bacterium]
MRTRTRPPVHPGRIIREHYLEPLDLSLTELAETLGVSRKTLSKIVNEHGAVTPDMALRLSQALNTTAELWLGLQQEHDLWKARQETGWKAVRPVGLSGGGRSYV